MKAYELFYHHDVVAALVTLPASRRRRVVRFLAAVAESPHQEGDFPVRDQFGSRCEVKHLEGIILTWWVDHSTQRVHVLNLERG